ncbi:hypothetical protein [Nocardiopsis synnemataformans]|uniref:hypothetical protein n=1 Tax=Nocardiopsis synnemataformans TaxID=61305 RepID=UPI003EBD2968
MSDGLIDPDAIPLPISLTNLVMLESAADSLKEDGESIAGRAHDIRSSWSRLQGLYQAPEAETLFAVLDPVPDDGESVESDLYTVSGALNSFAERARELRSEMVALKTRAHVFLASIEGDDDWDEGGPLGGENPKVAEHNELLNEVTRIQTDYMEAERDCANAITALFGGPVFVPMNADGSDPPSGDEIGYGLSEPPVDMPTDWGSPQGTDHHWYVDVTHSFGDWTAGAAVELAGATGLHYEGQWGVPIIFGPLSANPWTNSQGVTNARNYGQDTALGLMYLSGFYTGEAPPPVEEGQGLFGGTYAWELDGWTMPSSPGEWWDNAGPYWTEVVEGALRLDEWEERPGYAITQIALDAAAGGGALKALRELNSIGGGGPDSGGADVNPMDGTPEFGGRAPEGVPSPEGIGDTADRSRESDALESLDSTLDRLAEHQNGSPTGPPAHSPDPAETPVTPQESSEPPVTASPESDSASEANGAEVPERDGAPQSDDAPAREGAESGTPEPTTREEYEALVRAEMVRNDPELREILEDIRLDLPERADAVDPDAPWTTSAVREPEMAMAGTGGGGNGGGGGGPVDAPTGGTGHTHVDSPATGSSSSFGGGGSGRGDLTLHGSNPEGPPQGPNRIPPASDEPIKLHAGDPGYPGDRQRFGDGNDFVLKPEQEYRVFDDHGNLYGTYTTNSDGEITEIRIESQSPKSRHPEFLNPRPNATYVVKVGENEYTFKTDEHGRTVYAEGELEHGRQRRNKDEQDKVNKMGRRYFELLNEEIIYDFKETHSRDPKPGEVELWDEGNWNGGHIFGSSEFRGPGERLNQVPMLDIVNQERANRQGIQGSFRRAEWAWDGLLTGKESSLRRGLGDHYEAQMEIWRPILEAGPQPPDIHVRFSFEEDPGLEPIKDPVTGEELPPPPARVVVEWSINGVKQDTLSYENHPE